MGQQTEGIGVALEVGDVAPELGTDLGLQGSACSFSKERLDGLLAAVAKRRIAHVVGQTGRSNDLPNLHEHCIV